MCNLGSLAISKNEPTTYEAQLEKVGTLAAFAHDFGSRVMEMDGPLPVNMFTGSKLIDQQELEQLEQILQDWPDEKEGGK